MKIIFEHAMQQTFLDSLHPALIDPFMADYLKRMLLEKNLKPKDIMCLELYGDHLYNQKWINWLQLKGIKITEFNPDILVLQ